MKVIECIPNFSEGRDRKKISAIKKVIAKFKVKILSCEMDGDHNRTVITFIGSPRSVFAAAFSAVKKASQIIDLTKHQGVHPRLGATDVLPFVPLSGYKNIDLGAKECVEMARVLGRKIATELKIPIYLYEKAASPKRPERKNLAHIRNQGYEQVRQKIATSNVLAPDYGPKKLGPAGATSLGVRDILIAYNINLATPKVEIAKKIASQLREKNGGLKGVKAIGLFLKAKNCAQVSMNLVDYKTTPPLRVYEEVEKLAKKLGTKILESELIGLIPEDATFKGWQKRMKFKKVSEKKILRG